MSELNNDNTHIYEYDVDLSADTAPAQVIRMVGNQKRVLEIGAGPGSITKHLRHTNDCRITALELDGEAIKKLMPYCEQIYQADLNSPVWSDLLKDEGRFDVVVAADVLEHVYEPQVILKQMAAFMNDDGCVVISVPHIGHSAIHACLLNEDFSYRDWGLLDKTHIRFFGIKNIQSLIENAGLKIVQAEYVVRRPEVTEFSDHWSRLDEDVRLALLKNPFGLVYQVVVKLVPETAVGQAISLMSMAPVMRAEVSQWEVMKSAVRPYLSHGFRSGAKKLLSMLGIRI